MDVPFYGVSPAYLHFLSILRAQWDESRMWFMEAVLNRAMNYEKAARPDDTVAETEIAISLTENVSLYV